MSGGGIFAAGFVAGILFVCALAVLAFRWMTSAAETVENISDDYSDGDTRPASLLSQNHPTEGKSL